MKTITAKLTPEVIVLLFMGVIYFIIPGVTTIIPKPFFSLILIMLGVVYLTGSEKINFEKISARKIFLTAIIFALILFTFPLTRNSDTTNYILGARTAFLGGFNPYVTSYNQFQSDTIFNEFKDYPWINISYPYSPLFLYVSGLLLFMSGGNFYVNIWLFKAFFLLTFIASIYIFHKLIPGSKPLYLFSMNPILLNELVKEAHVESLLVLLVISGLYFFKKEKYYFSFIALLSAALIKIYFIIFLPVFFLYFFKLNKNPIKKTMLMGAGGVLIFTLLYLPYWNGIETFTGINNLIVANSKTIISLNVLSVLLMPLVQYLFSDPYDNYAFSGCILNAIGVFVMIFYLLKNLKNNIFNFEGFVKLLNVYYLIFLFLLTNWFFPHYATVSIVLLIILYSYGVKRSSKYMFALTFFSSFYYLLLK